MNIFEGYKKAVEIYNKNSGTEDGRKTVTWYNNKLGVSKEYLVWFTTCVICHRIPLYAVLHAYRDWKRYVVSYYKKTSQPIPNIESLNYQQTMKIINECKRHWAKPNPIYNQNGVYVGEFKSFRDANMLPINTNWCITKTTSRYNEFNNENSKCLYVINNRNQDPWRRVIAVVYSDRVEYWDSTNTRMDDNTPYENTLPSEVVGIIHSKRQKTNENKQHKTRYNMKKTIRLTESDLHRVIEESVKRCLKETQKDLGNDEWNGHRTKVQEIFDKINDASLCLKNYLQTCDTKLDNMGALGECATHLYQAAHALECLHMALDTHREPTDQYLGYDY